MKRNIPGFLILCLSTWVAAGQKPEAPQLTRPNFSGTWERVKDRYAANRVLVIKHIGDEIVIEDSSEHEKKSLVNKYTLYTDNRGEDNLIVFGGSPAQVKVRSKTGW